MHGKTIVLLIAAAFGHAVCAGEIYRCTAPNGDVMYTNIACPTTSRAQQIGSYVPEQAVPSAQVQAEAVQAVAISARLAQEAAQRAEAAAYEAAAYRHEDGEASNVDYNYGDNLLWYPAYPYAGSGFLPHVQHHRHHDGGHDGGHGGGGHGGDHGGGHAHGGPMQPVSPMSVNLLMRR